MDRFCANHPDSPSVGACKACEKSVCLMCVVDSQGSTFCSEACVKAYHEVRTWLDQPAAEDEWNPLAAAPKPAAPPKSPPKSAPAKVPPPPVAPLDLQGTEVRKAFDQIFETAEPAPEPVAAGRGGGLLIGGLLTLAVLSLVTAYVFRPSPPPRPPETARIVPSPKPAADAPRVDLKPEPAPVPKPAPKVEPAPLPKPEPPEPKAEPLPAPKPEPKPAPKPEPPPVPIPIPTPPAPPPPKPEPRPLPVAATPLPAHLEIHADPWAGSRPGTWLRLRTRFGDEDSYTDLGMKEVGPGFRVLVSQTSRLGRIEPDQYLWTEPLKLKVTDRADRELPGRTIACDVVETAGGPGLRHVIREGRQTGVSLPADAELLQLDGETLEVKGRSFPCAVAQFRLKGVVDPVRVWTSPQFPFSPLRREQGGTITELVDFGDDWGKRPPFPPTARPEPVAKLDPPLPKPEPAPAPAPKPEPKPAPKPEPVPTPAPKPEPKPEPKAEPKAEPKPEPRPAPKADPVPAPAPKPEPPPVPKPAPKPEPGPQDRYKKLTGEAAALLRSAAPHYEELSDAAENLPTDEAALKDLFNKAELTRTRLLDARTLYQQARPQAQDPALIDRRLEEIKDLLKPLEETLRLLRSRTR